MSSRSPEDAARAERHVREGEARVARQIVLIEKLKRDGHPRAAEEASMLLVTLQTSLELFRDHLRIERARAAAMPPDLP
jgi:hypothetical protein